MPITQSIDSALQSNIGQHGVSAEALSGALARAEVALDWLRARHADGGLPLLKLPATTDDLAAVRDAAARLKEGATDIVLLGTGGSSLGGQTLAQLASYGISGSMRCAPVRASTSWTISIRIRLRRCSAICRWPPRALSRFPNPAAPARR